LGRSLKNEILREDAPSLLKFDASNFFHAFAEHPEEQSWNEDRWHRYKIASYYEVKIVAMRVFVWGIIIK
tara:strand:+ start:224 stop:433 length:210 start_codon:yes stop_codon:yes gene_type:complete